MAANFDLLLQPEGGLLTLGPTFHPDGDGPDFVVQVVRARTPPTHRNVRVMPTDVAGSGVGVDFNDALPRAAAEAMERTCTAVFHEEQIVRAGANELGAAALDLGRIPVCSRRELSHPRCPLTLPDKAVPIRWIEGLSLETGDRVYLPLVMTHYYTGYEPGERFWAPISTGCAAHASYDEALIGGICEVIERDALSVAWLQRLPLPRLAIDVLPNRAADHWRRFDRASAAIEYHFFDATSDIGVPTVLGIQICRADRRRTTLVSCACAPDPADALVKVLREFVSHRIAAMPIRPIPRTLDECTGLNEGATLMAHADQLPAFDCLVNSPNKSLFSSLGSFPGNGPKETLTRLLDRLRHLGMEVFAADLSTDEALRCGLRAVRVLIPALQPFAYSYRARYLGHPRLYDAPRKMGYKVVPEAKLNPWPMPFA